MTRFIPFMSSPTLVLLERESWWAPIMRRVAGHCLVIESRTWQEIWERLASNPTLPLVLEFRDSHAELWLEHTRKIRQRCPSVAITAVMAPGLRAYRWLLREAGAADVASSAVELPRLARVAMRQASRFTNGTEPATGLPVAAELAAPHTFVTPRSSHR